MYRHLSHIYTGPLNILKMTLFTFDGKAVELTTETFDDILKDFAYVNRNYQQVSAVISVANSSEHAW